MARPEKLDENKRDITLRLRVTAAEKSRIWQNAKEAGRTPSDYLRGLALNAKPARTVPTPDRELLLKYFAELNMHGSNLNQIARQWNRKHDEFAPDSGERDALYMVLRKHDLLVDTIRGLLTA